MLSRIIRVMSFIVSVIVLSSGFAYAALKDAQHGQFQKKYFAVKAYQFGFSPSRIVVKKDEVVQIILTSRDVTHGFSIPAYNINETIQKGETKRIKFIANKRGTFTILCSVYCGSGHQNMKGTLVVE